MKIPPVFSTFSRYALLAVSGLSFIFANRMQAAPPWGTPQMQPGIAIVTCIAPDKDVSGAPVPASAAFVCGLLDLRNPSASDYGVNGPTAPLWNPPMHHELSWNAENLGMLFASEIDADGDMYVGAGGLYPASWSANFYRRYGNLGGGATSLAAAGTIYKIDRLSGVPTIFSVLPQQATNLGAGFVSGPGVGNVAYDADFDQFFATNLEDGMIYRIPAAGGPPIGTAFDPLTPDDGAPGMPPLRERLWGICVYNKQVYYAVWNTGDVADPGKIRRVDLDATGAIVPGTDVEILTVPGSSTLAADWNAVQAPVGDIEISADGQTMILAQRTQRNWGGYVATANHAGKVFIAQLSGTTWSVTNTLETGNSWGHGETYGGTDFGMESGADEQVIWASSADLAGGPGPHGLQGTRPADFPVTSAIVPLCYKVPYDPAYTASGPDYKGIGGDVDIMQSSRCVEIFVDEIHCPTKPDEPFSVDLTLTNHTGTTAHYLWLTPCLDDDLPTDALTAQPEPAGIITLSAPVENGDSFHQTITLPASAAGQTICFRVTLLDESGEECCTEKICIDLPNCDCMEVIDQKISCEVTETGLIKYTIELTVQNLTHLGVNPFDFSQFTFLPPSGFSPSVVTPSPDPIVPGNTGTIKTCYFGVPGPLCFNLTVHDATLIDCCSIDLCLDLPDCPPGADEPDECKLERRIACCPDPTGLPPHATAHFTICNNSSVPRTYTWTPSSTLIPPCTRILPLTAFSPPGGTIGPVMPGDCVTVPIQIFCEEFEPGDCAAYAICFSFDPTVEPMCCRGEVYRPAEGEVVVKSDEDIAGLGLAPGETERVSFRLENPGTAPLEASLKVIDEIGILSLSEGDGVFQSPYVLKVTVPPGESVPVALTLTRADDGHNAPRFTSLLVYNEDGTLYRPLLDLPIRLRAALAEGRLMAIKGFIPSSALPEPSVTLTVETTAGKRYRVQESGDLDMWRDARCSVLDAAVNPDGTFNGTGDDITCTVPCALDDLIRFYRVLQLP